MLFRSFDLLKISTLKFLVLKAHVGILDNNDIRFGQRICVIDKRWRNRDRVCFQIRIVVIEGAHGEQLIPIPRAAEIELVLYSISVGR